MVATTVGEDEETPPPSTPLSVSTLLSRCVQFMCMHSCMYNYIMHTCILPRCAAVQLGRI